MKKFFLIGNDISKSLSPKIHSIIYREYDIDAKYELYQIQDIKEAIKLFNIADGLNITAPFKDKITKYLKHNFAQINSVNTMIVHNLSGYSTDGLGFMLDAKRLGLNIKRVYIIGSGGAAISIMHELSKIESEIFIHDRKHDVFDTIKKINPSLVINATPVKFGLDKVYDLKYNDYEGISGIGMLIYQAILSSELFLGTKINLSIFSKILRCIQNEN
ncbi:MAG: hypothetical protein FWE03_01620 [Firmicutes bacterium]|nr:hypothetical protein [Bacillota bacterium]